MAVLFSSNLLLYCQINSNSKMLVDELITSNLFINLPAGRIHGLNIGVVRDA